MTFSNYITHTGKALAGVSITGMELVFSEYPVSNITEKNLM